MKQEEIQSLTKAIIEDIHNFKFYAESVDIDSVCFDNQILFDYYEPYLLANRNKPQLPDYLEKFVKINKEGDEYSVGFQNGCELELFMDCLDQAFKKTQAN